MARRIARNIYVIYSPDEGIYYLERRVPGSWAVSIESFDSETDAIDAYMVHRIEWKLA